MMAALVNCSASDESVERTLVPEMLPGKQVSLVEDFFLCGVPR